MEHNTQDSANAYPKVDSIVINEIMYHYRPEYAVNISGDDILSTSNLISFSSPWRYNATGSDLGTNWADVHHAENGSDWLVGNGLLGFELTPQNIPEPIGTGNLTSGYITYYFETDFVGLDNIKASFDAINLFIAEGYRDIGIIAFEPLLDVAHQRIEGYKKALLKNGMPIDLNLIRTISYKNIQEEVRKHVTELVQDGIRALLFTSNRIGITGLHRLNELKVRIPQDIAVISYDDNDFYPLMTPSICVISQPIEEMGKQAVEMLLARFKQPDNEFQSLIMAAELIKRNSI